MKATKVSSEMTQLDVDPATFGLQGGDAESLRIIIIGKGGDCKKYTSADGDVVYVCG